MCIYKLTFHTIFTHDIPVVLYMYISCYVLLFMWGLFMLTPVILLGHIALMRKYDSKYRTAGNFCQEKISPILSPALIGKNLSTNFFFSVKEYITNMATFTALVKILSHENFQLYGISILTYTVN